MPNFGQYAEMNTGGAPPGSYGGSTPTPDATGGNIAGSVLSLQMWLAANGFNPGPLDGIMGPRTAAARDAAIAAGVIDQAGNVTGTAAQQAYEDRTGDTGTPYSIYKPPNVMAGSTTGGGGTTSTGGGGTGGGGTGGGGTGGGGTGGGGTGGGGTGGGGTSTGSGTGAAPPLRILDSRNGRKFYKSGDKWYVGYTMASGRELIFEATEEQMTAIYGTWRPEFENTTLSALVSRTGVTFAGGIEEVTTTEVAWFEDEVERVTALALDEGILPSWAKNDPKAMDILYIAQSEGKSNDWVLEQLSKLDSFKDRFPGLDAIQAITGGDIGTAITGWLEFESGVKQSLVASGMDPSVMNPAMVGELLSQGHSLTTIQTTIAAFDRMETFGTAFDAFNEILAAQGMDTIDDLQGMFEFAAGLAPSEMYDVYEASSIAEAMKVAGLDDVFTAEDAIAIGLETDQTLATATAAAKKSAEMLLRLRHEVNVGDFGLDTEELIDISFGRAPRSGRNEAEIMDNINRAVQTAQANINTKRSDPYKAFNAQGTIKAASLGNLRQTS